MALHIDGYQKSDFCVVLSERYLWENNWRDTSGKFLRQTVQLMPWALRATSAWA